jgi:hypothetical protein
MNKVAASVEKAGTSYLAVLDKAHALTTTLYARINAAADKAAAALRMPPKVAAAVSRPSHSIIDVQQKFADKAVEVQKVQIDKVITRARGPVAQSEQA